MKTSDIIILSVAVAFFVIGVHQLMLFGWQQAYWIFMLTVALLFWYKLRKDKREKSKD
jgi:membrane protein implicated in regulation of membrane protease activity